MATAKSGFNSNSDYAYGCFCSKKSQMFHKIERVNEREKKV
jgi:hypothetical protein